MRLAFIRALGRAFGGDPGKIFGKAFGRTRIQGWPIGREFIFALKGTFLTTLTFMIRTTTGALSRRNCRSNRSSVVGKMLPDITVPAGIILRKAVGAKSRLCLRASAVASSL